MKVFLTEFHYKKKYNPLDYLLIAGLYLPSLCYGAVTSVRNFLYKKKVLKSFKSKLYTISVGNLTTGGTGKTPITAEIANYLAQKGERPAIISRGYGGKLSNKEVNVISDGLKINFGVLDSGDEPFWLAENCKGTAILTCSSRVKSAKFAQEKLDCTKLILDDGFQHQKLSRDLNILVVDAEKQFSNGKVLPLGALRESVSQISRADKLVVVNKSFEERGAKIFARILKNKFKKPAFVCTMAPSEVYDIKSGEELNQEKTVLAFSAIAQPEQFYALLKKYDVVVTKDFPDHHIYTNTDLKELNELKVKYGAQAMVTTEKDAVKLKELIDENAEIFALRLRPVLDVEGLLSEK